MNQDISHVDQDDVVQIILSKIKNIALDLNKGGEKNVRAIALLSIINGYTNLCKELKLDKPSDKIIELLIVKELDQLIGHELITATEDTQIELIYRSCIDLMSTLIVLRWLDSKDNRDNFINHKDILFSTKNDD